MLCVTGKETSLEAVRTRIEACQRLHPQALHEIRLDALNCIDPDLWSLIQAHGERLILCMRRPSEGGRFDGNESTRRDILHKGFKSGARWIDVEEDCSWAEEVIPKSHLILSWHCYESSAPLLWSEKVESMRARQPALTKVAVAVEDTTELAALKALIAPQSPAILLAMGPAGLASRVRYPHFGSPWTYVAATPRESTAPGQLCLEEALAMGLPQSASMPFFALIGGPQVMSSPGTSVYNALFRRRGLNSSYLPVVSLHFDATLSLLRELGLQGAAVTMPHKGQAWARADQFVDLAGARSAADDSANELQAANTLWWEGDRLLAANTDIAGVYAPLEEALSQLELKHPNALILGAGGAARAAAEACRRLGLQVCCAVRSQSTHRNLLPAWVELIDWEERAARSDFAILINATPLPSPWSEDLGAFQVVFELALRDSKPSPLLQAAQRAGCRTITALEMWCAQGAMQMQTIAQLPLATSELAALIED